MSIDGDSEPLTCPGCAAEIDGHLATKEDQPAPAAGGVSVCGLCATILVYTVTDDTLGLRYPTDDELLEILADPHVVEVVAYLRVLREAGR